MIGALIIRKIIFSALPYILIGGGLLGAYCSFRSYVKKDVVSEINTEAVEVQEERTEKAQNYDQKATPRIRKVKKKVKESPEFGKEEASEVFDALGIK